MSIFNHERQLLDWRIRHIPCNLKQDIAYIIIRDSDVEQMLNITISDDQALVAVYTSILFDTHLE